jgi:branched-chain amino acid transport system substrate-binding protein
MKQSHVVSGRLSYLSFYFILAVIWGLAITPVSADTVGKPVRIGLTAEFGLKQSYSAQAIEMGIRVAIEEINGSGGVLGGRPLVLETMDDRSVPARAVENVKKFNAMDDMVAVFGARFSPVLLELLPLVHDIGMILLDPWGSADGITDNGYSPNYTFRLSLKDSLAMPAILSHAKKRGLKNVGLLLPNTAWGRSNENAAKEYVASQSGTTLVAVHWYNWGDTSLLNLYHSISAAGADVLVFVANDREGSILINEMMALPSEKRLPILSHWGVTGGQFFEKTKDVLLQLDFAVVQTFSFFATPATMRERFMATAARLYPGQRYETIQAPVGVGHGYDLTHLLAMAVDKAGSTNREEIRSALESLGPYEGLVTHLDRPFSPKNHDALGIEQVFMAKYREDGALIPLAK